MGCLKSQATADTCLFATRLSKSVLLTKVSRRVCLDRKHLLSFCTKTMLKSPPPQLLGVHSPFAGPNWESPFAGPNCCKAFCRTMFKKAFLQDLQSFSPHIFFTFLIWMAASMSFPFASSRLTLSPIFCSFSSFARLCCLGCFPFCSWQPPCGTFCPPACWEPQQCSRFHQCGIFARFGLHRFARPCSELQLLYVATVHRSKPRVVVYGLWQNTATTQMVVY